MQKSMMTGKAKPFVKWVGGKTQLLQNIERKLPADFMLRNDITYVEPFVGGGAVLFWILQKYPNITHAVINDINPDLIKAYVTVQKQPKELTKRLRDIQDEYLALDEASRKAYYLEKRTAFNTKQLDTIENTALFIFLNRTCFNGLYRVNGKGLFNVPFGRYANPKICDAETVFADSELLQRVTITVGDFSETLKYADKQSLFYLDPPYKPLSETSSFNSYAKEAFDDDEQVRLQGFCKEIDLRHGHFLLSNSDVRGKNPQEMFFDDLYRDFDIQRVLASRMVNANAEKRGKLTELMISNFTKEISYGIPQQSIPVMREDETKYNK